MKRSGILLAAGLSRRFGAEDKLRACWRGQPLVSWPARAMVQAGLDALHVVVSDPEIPILLPPPFQARLVPRGAEMADSFRAAIAIARETDADDLVICLGDMPGIDSQVIMRLLDGDGSRACRHADRRLPPVRLIAADFQSALEGSQGDMGARNFLRGLSPDALIALSAEQARDIDTLSDLWPEEGNRTRAHK